ncbi:MAG: hypothetical protein ACJATT_001343 [Myxococcota bacterium]|jgi:hypothetical protein
MEADAMVDETLQAWPMSLMEETGARVRSGASPTDDVVTCYY